MGTETQTQQHATIGQSTQTGWGPVAAPLPLPPSPSPACRLVADMSTRRCCHLTQCRLPRSPADGDHVTLDSESHSPPSLPLSPFLSLSLSASLCNSLTAFSHAVYLLHATRWSRLALPGTSSFLLLLPLNLSSTNSFKMVSVLRKILFFYNFSSALICWRVARVSGSTVDPIVSFHFVPSRLVLFRFISLRLCIITTPHRAPLPLLSLFTSASPSGTHWSSFSFGCRFCCDCECGFSCWRSPPNQNETSISSVFPGNN